MSSKEESEGALHQRRPREYHAVDSASRGRQIVLNDSAPLRVEDRQEMAADIGLVCLPIGQPFCKIASYWPVLVYAQAGIEAIYYRRWTGQEYGKLQPVERFSKLVVPVEGRVPDPSSETRLNASQTLHKMRKNREERKEKAKQWRETR